MPDAEHLAHRQDDATMSDRLNSFVTPGLINEETQPDCDTGGNQGRARARSLDLAPGRRLRTTYPPIEWLVIATARRQLPHTRRCAVLCLVARESGVHP
jgi:hypothetical protein